MMVRSYSPRAVLQWAVETFGEGALDPHERACRFVEEAIELAQAMGVDQQVVAATIARVYSREPGEPAKEVGQSFMTLECVAETLGLNARREVSIEFDRVQRLPRDYFTKRHAAKVELGISSFGMKDGE